MEREAGRREREKVRGEGEREGERGEREKERQGENYHIGLDPNLGNGKRLNG